MPVIGQKSPGIQSKKKSPLDKLLEGEEKKKVKAGQLRGQVSPLDALVDKGAELRQEGLSPLDSLLKEDEIAAEKEEKKKRHWAEIPTESQKGERVWGIYKLPPKEYKRGRLAPKPEEVPYTPTRLPIPEEKPPAISTSEIFKETLKTQLKRTLGIPTEKLPPVKPLEAYKASLSFAKKLVPYPLKAFLKKPYAPSEIPTKLKKIAKAERGFIKETGDLITEEIYPEVLPSIIRYIDKKLAKQFWMTSNIPWIRNYYQKYYQENYGAEAAHSEIDREAEAELFEAAKSLPIEMGKIILSNLRRLGEEPIETMEEKGISQLAIDALFFGQIADIGLRATRAFALAYKIQPAQIIKKAAKDLTKEQVAAKAREAGKFPAKFRTRVQVKPIRLLETNAEQKAMKAQEILLSQNIDFRLHKYSLDPAPPGVTNLWAIDIAEADLPRASELIKSIAKVKKGVYAKPKKELDLFQQIKAQGGIYRTKDISAEEWRRIPPYLKRGKAKGGRALDDLAQELGYVERPVPNGMPDRLLLNDILAKNRYPSHLYAGEMPSKQITMAEEFESFMRGEIDATGKLMKEHLREVTPAIKGRMERGGVKIYRRAKGKIPPELKSKIPEVEVALTTQVRPGTIWKAMVQSTRNIKNSIAEAFVYEFTLRKYPHLQNELRLLKDAPRDAANYAVNQVVGIVGDLEKTEYELFRRLIALDDFVETAGLGGKLPHDIKIYDAAMELSRYRDMANPKVLRAIERHRELFKAIGEDLAGRGKIAKELLRDKYFPHHVLDYSFGLSANLPWMPRRLKISYRGYSKTRFGSVRDINTDYIDVVNKHLARVFLDNTIDDFAKATALRYDIMPQLSKDVRLKIFGESGLPQPGNIYVINGKTYRGYQIQPGNTLYRGLTTTEKLAEQAISESWSAEEVIKSLKEAGVLGRPYKVYVLPEEISKRLYKFRIPYRNIPLVPQLRTAVRIWKGITLAFAGASFQINNFIGDTINIYREDIGALLRYPKAANALRKNAPKVYDDLMELAKQQRVLFGSGYLREVGGARGGVWSDPRIAHLTGFKGKAARTTGLYWKLNEYREDVPRLALFMKKVEDIRAGKLIYSKTVNIEGLGQIEAAGKIARTVPIDYGALTPLAERNLRSLLFPFYTFYVGNFRNWAKYIVRHPLEATAKVGVPYAAMWIWNNTMFPEVERSLPPWRRWEIHLNTGWLDKDEKAIVLRFQTPVELAAKFVGLDRLPDKITRIWAGEMTVKQAAKEQLKDTILGSPRMMKDLLAPMVKVVYSLASNKDSYTGKKIVPDKLKGTPEGNKMIWAYSLGQILTPLGQYMRMERKFEEEAPIKRTITGVFTPPVVGRVDLEQAEFYKKMEQVDKQIKAEQDILTKIEKKYIRDVVAGNRLRPAGYWKKASEKYKDLRPIISSDTVINRLSSVRVQLDIARKLLARAKTEEEKVSLKRRILALKRKQRSEIIESQKKRIRP